MVVRSTGRAGTFSHAFTRCSADVPAPAPDSSALSGSGRPITSPPHGLDLTEGLVGLALRRSPRCATIRARLGPAGPEHTHVQRRLPRDDYEQERLSP